MSGRVYIVVKHTNNEMRCVELCLHCPWRVHMCYIPGY